MEALTLAASLDSLEPIGQYIIEVSKEANLDEDTLYNLRLAIDEIVTNIVTHGYGEAGLEGPLWIQAVCDDQFLQVRIEDIAPAFDPCVVLIPQLDLPAKERAIGGLGLYLVRQSVDDFSYKRVGNRNCNILAVKKPHA